MELIFEHCSECSQASRTSQASLLPYYCKNCDEYYDFQNYQKRLKEIKKYLLKGYLRAIPVALICGALFWISDDKAIRYLGILASIIYVLVFEIYTARELQNRILDLGYPPLKIVKKKFLEHIRKFLSEQYKLLTFYLILFVFLTFSFVYLVERDFLVTIVPVLLLVFYPLIRIRKLKRIIQKINTYD